LIETILRRSIQLLCSALEAKVQEKNGGGGMLMEMKFQCISTTLGWDAGSCWAKP
jgi:hypothetical protein